MQKKKKFLITEKQLDALNYLQDDKTSEIMLSGSAGSAKSIIAQFWGLKMCLKYAGFRLAIVRKDINLSKTTVIESLYEVMDLQGIPRSVMKEDKELNQYRFENGSVIQMINGTISPIDEKTKLSRLGSLQISAFIIDECNQIEFKFYEILSTRLRFRPPSMADVIYIEKAIVITNPDSNSWLYTHFWKKYENKTLPLHMAVIHSTLEENPHLPESYKQRMRNLKEPEHSRLYLGKWVAQNDDNLIQTEKLERVFSPELLTYEVTHISIDPSRFGKDKSIVILWDNLRIVKILKFEKLSTRELADEVQRIMDLHSISPKNVICDVDGLGAGVVDNLRCIGIHNNGTAVNKENFYNVKTQCYFKFSTMISDIIIHASPDDIQKIKQEFGAINSIIRNDDKFKITSKDEIKRKIGRSPDYSDAIAYGCWFHLKKKKSGLNHIFGSASINNNNDMYKGFI